MADLIDLLTEWAKGRTDVRVCDLRQFGAWSNDERVYGFLMLEKHKANMANIMADRLQICLPTRDTCLDSRDPEFFAKLEQIIHEKSGLPNLAEHRPSIETFGF